MSATTKLDALAIALRDEAAKFNSPVRYYVEPQARILWDRANPGKDSFDDGPDIDWDLESWKILVRAVLVAAREPSEAMLRAGERADWVGENESQAGASIMPEKCGIDHPSDYPCHICGSPGIWPAMVDAMLREGQ